MLMKSRAAWACARPGTPMTVAAAARSAMERRLRTIEWVTSTSSVVTGARYGGNVSLVLQRAGEVVSP